MDVKTNNKFSVGDRVKRELDIYDKSKGYKIGTIVRRYSRGIRQCGSCILGPYDELYEVVWDNRETEKGFLPHGLDAIK